MASEPERERLIECIERRTRRKVVIDAVETNDALAICHPQSDSILFSLPREIRDEIWAYSTAAYENMDEKYPTNEYYYRRGHTARLKSDTTLLLTCRRIWLEANRFPMLQAEHCFWYYRAAPDGRDREWMSNLTALNRQNFGHLHLFAQMFAIERLRADLGHLRLFFLPTDLVNPADFQPRMLHVTIRHTDWWNWEWEAPLTFKDSWLQALLDTPDLRSTQTLVLELETLDYKVPQLLPIVERLEKLESREFATHTIDGRKVTTKFVLQPERQESDWSGPIDINNMNFRPYKGKDRLNYHIITLTWKLHFPELPNAHIPSIRLAPRIQSFQPLSSVRSPRGLADESDSYLRNRRPAASDHSYFAKPMRRRDYKKLKKNHHVPRLNQPGAKALDEGLRVRMVSVAQAEQTEHFRWVEFNRSIQSFWTETYSAPWESSGPRKTRNTLLRFAE